jgi:ribosomal protein S18 acetylase RimI-like enzyme
MNADITIREIKKTEYPLLEDFLYNAIYIPKSAEYPPREIIFEPEIYVYIKDFGMDTDCGVVAEQGGVIIGAAWTRIIHAYGHIDNNTPELAISVLSEHHSRGVGTMLMNSLFDLLRKRGYRRTSLSVQQDNPAVRFYTRLGYRTTDEKLDPAGHEDYIMVKELYDIKPLSKENLQATMDLVWRVFMEFEAPDYSDEGVAEFKRFIDEAPQNEQLRMWGCFDGDDIIGVIAIRPPCHIALLFVDKEYHRRGIARSLFMTVLSDNQVVTGHSAVTVNSSPYAVEAYRHLGFVNIDTEQLTNGIRYYPMTYALNVENRADAD